MEVFLTYLRTGWEKMALQNPKETLNIAILSLLDTRLITVKTVTVNKGKSNSNWGVFY
jgi:hypothetical protein